MSEEKETTTLTGRVLVVDDERTTREALCEGLRQLGHDAVPAGSGEAALTLLQRERFDAVILDLRMPGVSGIDVLTATADANPETAFIILTAYASTDSAIAALRSRAFDYLIKPSSLETIFDTVHKALRRNRQQRQQRKAVTLLRKALSNLQDVAPEAPVSVPETAPMLSAAGIRIDQQRQAATYHEESLDLTPVQYRLLQVFVRRPGIILSYRELARASHDADLEEEEARTLLRSHLYRLSRKLGDSETSPLQSVRGRGYILQQA